MIRFLNRNVFKIALVLPLAIVWARTAFASGDITMVHAIDAAGGIKNYKANRAPLAASRLVELPLGAVRPGGWLRKQLELQADGFHGHLTEISAFLKKDKNSWLDSAGRGEHGWEEVPYWLKGYIGAAYLLNNKRMIDESQIWIEGALRSQQADGWFGPGSDRTGVATDLKGRDDLWPNMIMLFCLQTYYDCTGDARVIDVMTRYFKYLEALPEEKFLVGYWPSMRGGDQLYSILWLYNRTGEKWLLDLARKTHRKTARWDQDVINWHNVNVAQAFREPAVFGLLSKDPADLAATGRDWKKVRAMYGQVPGGMFGADENARPGYNGPRQAIETCGMVEEMLSDEILTAVSGDPAWADRCENVAFNSLPASMTADLKALRYLTAPNQPMSDHTSKSPGIQNGGDMYCMNPHSHRCCQHNCGHGWPYYTAHLWYAAAGDGLAAMCYGPCEVDAAVAGGTMVHIAEATHYPFDEKIELTIAPAAAVRFPLYLRIPAWCDGAKIEIDGQQENISPAAGEIVRIERQWVQGDTVVLTLPMQVRVNIWKDNRGFASIDRGPLTYSLAIKERYQRHGGTDEWPAWDVMPDSPWNYGLVLDKDRPAAGIHTHFGDWPADNQPFAQDATPVTLVAQAKRIPNWGLDSRHLVEELIESPVKSAEPEEAIKLVPMGAARLRITAFPVIGDGPDAHDWPASHHSDFAATASHCFDADTTDALGDKRLPRSSGDHSMPRFTWWDHRGTAEWLELKFAAPRRISSVEVYWFDDTGKGQCRVPASWKVLYDQSGKGQWQPVQASDDYGVSPDRFNKVTFAPITAGALRLDVQLQPGFSGGVLRVRVH